MPQSTDIVCWGIRTVGARKNSEDMASSSSGDREKQFLTNVRATPPTAPWSHAFHHFNTFIRLRGEERVRLYSGDNHAVEAR